MSGVLLRGLNGQHLPLLLKLFTASKLINSRSMTIIDPTLGQIAVDMRVAVKEL